MANYATVADLRQLKRTMTAEEEERAESVIPIICAELRIRADMVGKDLDEMVSSSADYASVVKSVVCDITIRELDAIRTSESNAIYSQASQISESAGGLSQSFTLPNTGGGIFIKKSELTRLGLRRQVLGVINMMGGTT